MAESQNSSFIPNAPVNSAAAAPRGRKVYILSYISFVLFFGTLIATGIVFFLGFQQDKALALQQQQLKDEQTKFGDATLIEVREVSDRIEAANKILNEATSPVSILLALEFSMLKSIGVTGFSFKKLPEGGMYQLEMAATAPSFNAPIFQREILATNPILDGAVITDATLGTVESGDGSSSSEGSSDGGVTFKIVKLFTAADIPHQEIPPFALEALGTGPSDAGSVDLGEALPPVEGVDDGAVLPDAVETDDAASVETVTDTGEQS